VLRRRAVALNVQLRSVPHGLLLARSCWSCRADQGSTRPGWKRFLMWSPTWCIGIAALGGVLVQRHPAGAALTGARASKLPNSGKIKKNSPPPDPYPPASPHSALFLGGGFFFFLVEGGRLPGLSAPSPCTHSIT